MKRKYGISATQFAEMESKQGGLCAICSRKNDRGSRLFVDHSHATGKVRGLLCNSCNTALGMFNDDPSRISAAVEYLSVSGR